MTNLGLSTTLFILALSENKYVGILNYTGENSRRIKIYLRHEGNLWFSRLAVNNKPLTFSQMRRAQRRSITILNKSTSEGSQGYIRSTYSHLDPASYPPWYNPDFHRARLHDQDNESVWIRNAYRARFIIKSYAFLVFPPFGIAAGAIHWNSSVVFVLNFLALIHLPGLLKPCATGPPRPWRWAVMGLLNAGHWNSMEWFVSVALVLNGLIIALD